MTDRCSTCRRVLLLGQRPAALRQCELHHRTPGEPAVTDLLDAYLTHRDQGHSHHAALLALARRFDLTRRPLTA